MARKKKITQNLAIVALLLNIFILPGLGTIIGGDTKTGVTQLVLAIIAIPLSIVLVGIPLYLAMWIWGIVSGVKMIKAAS